MKRINQLLKFALLLGVVSPHVSCNKLTENANDLIRLDVDTRRSNQAMASLLVFKEADSMQLYQNQINHSVDELFKYKKLEVIDAQLKEIEKTLIGFDQVYWKAYLLYYKSVFYKTIQNEDKQAEKAIEESLEVLSEKVYMNSEYYALLAMCTSFSIQFANIVQLAKIASEVEEYAQQALALNKENLRAYVVLASHNFHTPKMFGGRLKVEEYALKGLSCPDAIDTSLYAPTWGRTQLYRLLIQYYEAEGKTEAMERLKKKYNI